MAVLVQQGGTLSCVCRACFFLTCAPHLLIDQRKGDASGEGSKVVLLEVGYSGGVPLLPPPPSVPALRFGL